jgi:hypothetical protein
MRACGAGRRPSCVLQASGYPPAGPSRQSPIDRARFGGSTGPSRSSRFDGTKPESGESNSQKGLLRSAPDRPPVHAGGSIASDHRGVWTAVDGRTRREPNPSWCCLACTEPGRPPRLVPVDLIKHVLCF